MSTGAAISYATENARNTAATGIVRELVSTTANALVKDVIVRKDSKVNINISDDGPSTQTMSEGSNRKEYRTQVVTAVNKANLELEETQLFMSSKTSLRYGVFFLTN